MGKGLAQGRQERDQQSDRHRVDGKGISTGPMGKGLVQGQWERDQHRVDGKALGTGLMRKESVQGQWERDQCRGDAKAIIGRKVCIPVHTIVMLMGNFTSTQSQ